MIWRYAIGVIVAGILGLWSGLRSSGTEEPRDSKGIDYTSQEFGRRSTFRTSAAGCIPRTSMVIIAPVGLHDDGLSRFFCRKRRTPPGRRH